MKLLLVAFAVDCVTVKDRIRDRNEIVGSSRSRTGIEHMSQSAVAVVSWSFTCGFSGLGLFSQCCSTDYTRTAFGFNKRLQQKPSVRRAQNNTLFVSVFSKSLF